MFLETMERCLNKSYANSFEAATSTNEDEPIDKTLEAVAERSFTILSGINDMLVVLYFEVDDYI